MLCDNCGYRNNDNNDKCINCGNKINKFSDDEKKKIKLRLEEKNNYLIPSLSDKIIKFIFFVFAIFIFIFNMYNNLLLIFNLLITFSAVFAGLTAGYPKVIWKIRKIGIKLHSDGADDLTPNYIWHILRRISCWLMFTVSIGLTLKFYNLV